MTYMHNHLQDMDSLFEGVYEKLKSPDFGKNLGGELALYIQPVPPEFQNKIDEQVQRLCNRLGKKGLSSVSINLYDLCMEILAKEGVLDTILEEETNLDKNDIVATLDSVLDIKSVLVPRIESLVQEANPNFIFISGVGNVYPFVRSHGILNNIDELTDGHNLILFFPGDYNNLQLKLFGRISDENYYRGHNLNDINI